MTKVRFLLIVCMASTFSFCCAIENCKNTIYIDDNEPPSKCTEQDTVYKCGSLQSAFEKDLNETCIILTNDTTLDVPIRKEKIEDFRIFSTTGNVTVFCSSQQSGLKFSQSLNIVFENITFHGCGATSAIDWNQGLVNISSALTFIQCDNVNLKGLHLSSSLGYAFSIVDSSVFLSESSAVKSQFVNVLHDDLEYPIGGGIFVTFQRDEYGSSKTIEIKTCEFLNNVGMYTFLDESIYDDLPFGRGIGISFSCGQYTENNVFITDNVTVSENQGNIGSGIFIEYDENTVNNSFIVMNSQIISNIAHTAAGGVLGLTSSVKENHIHIKHTNISNNSAKIGGGVAFVLPDTFDDGVQTGLFMLENITVDNNEAQVGGSFHFQNVFVTLRDVKVLNTNANSVLSVKGSIYALRSRLQFFGNRNLIQNNSGSAIVIDNSEMFANGTIVFRKNIGDTGGALSIYEHSKLILTNNADLLFDGNTADKEGGAIYALTAGPPIHPWETTELTIYQCFLQFDKGINYQNFQGNVKFRNNECIDGDSDDIFVSSVQPCRNNNENRTHVFSHWQNFHFPANKSTIATNAVCLRSLTKSEWHSYPGNLLKPHIVLQDDRGNNVSESIDIKIHPKKQVTIDTNDAFVTSNEDSIKLQLKKKVNHPVTFSVTVKTTSNLFLEKNITNLTFKDCPFGFTFDEEAGMCECDIKNNQDLNIAFCDSEFIFLQRNRWVNPNETKTYTCPNKYCHNDIGRFNRYNKSKQCKKHRLQTSRLCSKCDIGYSAVSGSYECEKCPEDSKGWISITFVLVFALLGFILLVFTTGIDIMSYNLNICFFSYQVIDSLYTSDQTIDKFLSFIMSLFQVSDRNNIYPTMCLWYGMTALGKMSMGFIVPVAMLLWMAVSYIICFKVKQEIVFRETVYSLKDRWYKTMSIVIVMCFSDFLRISVQILHYIEIDGTKYVYMYADEEWFSPNHQPHAVVSVFVILILIGFSALQIWLLCKTNVTVFGGLLRKFENNVSEYFKMGHNWFWVFYFVCRVAIYCNGILMVNHLELQKGLMALICFAICIIFAKLQPYKKEFVNLVETIVLSTLAIISVVSMGIPNVYSIPEQNGLITFVLVLSYIPVLVLPISMFKEMYYDRKYQSRIGRRVSAPFPARTIGDYNNIPYQRFNAD